MESIDGSLDTFFSGISPLRPLCIIKNLVVSNWSDAFSEYVNRMVEKTSFLQKISNTTVIVPFLTNCACHVHIFSSFSQVEQVTHEYCLHRASLHPLYDLFYMGVLLSKHRENTHLRSTLQQFLFQLLELLKSFCLRMSQYTYLTINIQYTFPVIRQNSCSRRSGSCASSGATVRLRFYVRNELFNVDKTCRIRFKHYIHLLSTLQQTSDWDTSTDILT